MKDDLFASFSFSITEIKSGWIFAQADISDDHIEMANSYIGGLELPKALMHACHTILTGSTTSEWVCWHGESSAQIWHMEKSCNHLYLHIYEAGSSFGLPVCGDELKWVAGKNKLIITVELDVFTFVNSICEAFKAYRYGEALAMWQNSGFGNYFPDEEYKQLRQALRKLSIGG